MSSRISLSILPLALLIMAATTFAAEESFIIRTQVGDDTTPPSTPTILSADPIASTQIDISWSTSTDNFSFGGYRLFRDGFQIATTTLTSFSDTGLTASTTYTYTVNAFDTAGNTSTTSAPVSTTTPALPVVLTPTSSEETSGGQTSSYVRPQLETLSIDPALRSVEFQFQTHVPSRYSLRWGRTSAYDGGFVISDIYRRTHRTVITDLEPGTVYEYELVGYDGAGRSWPLERGTFRTAEPPDAQPPLNVSDLRAFIDGNDVQLRWVNPPSSDFAYVRIMRSQLFYPVHPHDGYFRYQGDGTAYRDIGALREYDTQFYTVFAYDKNGNVSSGAVVYISRDRTGSGVTPTPTTPYIPPEPTGPVEEEYQALETRDVIIKQNGRLYALSAPDITLYTEDPVTVSVPYEAVPEHLKSIVVDFVAAGETSAYHSFLLRINRDKTAYEAIVPSFTLAGDQVSVEVTVFDHLYQRAVQVRGSITLRSGTRVTEEPEILFPDRLLPNVWEWSVFLFIGFLFFLFLLWRRRKKEEEEER